MFDAVATQTFEHAGRVVHPGDALQLSALDFAIYQRRRLIRPAQLVRRDITPEPQTNTIPPDAPPVRRSRRRDLKA